LNVLIIIQARTGSKRLPNKVLLKIKDKPILQHIINSLKYCKKVDQIIVATSTLKTDDEIEKLCFKMNVECFRGNSSNVLKRYHDCSKKFHGEIIVRVTADNPLIDPTIIDKGISLLTERKMDYVSNMIHQSFPIGYLVEVFTFTTLKRMFNEHTDNQSKEHVTFQLRKHPKGFKIGEFFAPKNKQRPNWRLTVDYLSDLKLIKKIYYKLYNPNSFIKYNDVFDFLEKNPKLLEINKDNSQ
jgi:spore coat polysaccharide biosynthesis protein SpsF